MPAHKSVYCWILTENTPRVLISECLQLDNSRHRASPCMAGDGEQAVKCTVWFHAISRFHLTGQPHWSTGFSGPREPGSDSVAAGCFVLITTKLVAMQAFSRSYPSLRPHAFNSPPFHSLPLSNSAHRPNSHSPSLSRSSPGSADLRTTTTVV